MGRSKITDYRWNSYTFGWWFVDLSPEVIDNRTRCTRIRGVAPRIFCAFVATCARGFGPLSGGRRPSCGRAREVCSHGLGLSKPNMAQTQLVFSFTSNDYLITESLRPCWATGNSEEHTHSINKATELLYVVLVSCTFSRYQIYYPLRSKL